MLNILLFLAALSASTPPADGRWLYIGDDDQGMGVLDASRVERDGDRATVRVVVAMAELEPGESRLVQFIQEWDCKTRLKRYQGAHAFDDAIKPVSSADAPREWTSTGDATPFGRVRAYVCDGEPLPEAGTSYPEILRRYLARFVI